MPEPKIEFYMHKKSRKIHFVKRHVVAVVQTACMKNIHIFDLGMHFKDVLPPYNHICKICIQYLADNEIIIKDVRDKWKLTKKPSE